MPAPDAFLVLATLQDLWRNRLQAMHIAEPNGLPLTSRLRLAKLEFAVTRWESAVILALTILGTIATALYPGTLGVREGAWKLILAAGASLTLVQISASFLDRDIDDPLLRRILRDHLGADGLGDEDVRAQVARSVSHRADLEVIMRNARSDAMPILEQVVAGIDQWLERIAKLARRVDELRGQSKVRGDLMGDLDRRISELEQRARLAKDPHTTAMLRQTLAGMQRQLQMLGDAMAHAERGFLTLENAVAMLGTACTRLATSPCFEGNLDDELPSAVDIDGGIEQINAMLAALERVGELDHLP
jgi:hypothetical protein